MLADVAAGGDRLLTLQALRDRLAAEIDECDSKRDLAALAQRLTEVLAQIAVIGAGRVGDAESETMDELSRRRGGRNVEPPRRGRAQNRR